MGREYTVEELAEVVGGTLRGQGSARICGVGDIEEAGPSQATWASRQRYEQAAQNCRAGVILVPKDFPATPIPAILCDNIEQAVARLLGAFMLPVSRPAPGIHSTAVVHEKANIGESTCIGPHVVVEQGVKIAARCVIHAGVFIGRDTELGEGCEIWPNVVIRDGCRLGAGVCVHSNAVIGADGFGYYFDGSRHAKIPHIGGVWIEDDVEIGACTCIDRAKFGWTIVGRGTKMDNQVQIGHNCRLGAHNILVGQTGVSGSVRTGDYCVFAARTAVFDNLSIGRGVRVGGLAMVTKDIPDGATVSGAPAQDLQAELREQASLRRLPKWTEKIKELIERVERLEASTDDNP